MSNYAKIKPFSIANGEGIRTSIFFSGCEFACHGCFNKDIQDFNVGKPFTKAVYNNEIKPTINEHVTGISVLGGEPLHPRNLSATFNLLCWFKRDFPNKTIWVWSGYTLEELLSDEYMIKTPSFDMIELILENIDVLVDGKFISGLKDLSLKWAGSSNQRVIDVRATLEKGEVILYD